MVNSEDFNKRLEIVLEYYGLNAASFADKIGVQRSSLSHLLSGRNKPSLDFVLKVIEEFPEVDLYWVLLGKGNFPKHEKEDQQNNTSLPSTPITAFFPKTTKATSVTPPKSDEKKPAPQPITEEQVCQIIMVYRDGSFKILNQLTKQ
ncbi:MAG: helix-turn-helix transcriptional regulator [Flavobacterium sp.]